MTIMIRDLVDLDGISKRVDAVDSLEFRESTQERLILRARELTLTDALRGVDYTNYVKGVSNAQMVKELYERLVPVHEIERGVVAPVYFVNQPFRKNGELCERISGIYSSDIVTYWSCAGHLPGEPQTGRDTGRIKPPCMFFFCGRSFKSERKEKYGQLMALLGQENYEVASMGGFGTGFMGKVTSDEESVAIAQMQDFWKFFLDDLNRYHGKSIFDLKLAEVIRPAARVPKV